MLFKPWAYIYNLKQVNQFINWFQRTPRLSNFAEKLLWRKLSQIITKPQNLEKVSSLESFLLNSGLLPTVRLLVIPEGVLMLDTLH